MKHQRKVVMHFILSLGKGGGAEKQLYNVVQLLTSYYEVHVVEFFSGNGYSKLLKEMNTNIHVHEINASSKFDLSSYIKLYKIIKSINPLVLNCWLPSGNIIGAVIGKLAGVENIVASVRNVDDWKGLGYRLLDKIVSYAWSKIIVCSEGVGNYLSRTYGFKKGKLSLIYNTPDQKLLKYQCRTSKEKVFSKIFRDNFEKDTILVCANRLEPHKRTNQVIQSVINLRKKGLPLKLIILGKGSEQEYLNDIIKNAGICNHISVEGWCDNIYDILIHSDLFVLVSEREGLPNSLLEAQYLGVPSIATDVGGSSEIIENNHTGWLLKKDFKQIDLDKKIEWIVKNKNARDIFSINAGTRTKQKFGPNCTLKHYNSLYTNLISKEHTIV